MTIDVKNAFNTIRWKNIIRTMISKQLSEYLIRIVIDYFKKKYVVMERLDTSVPWG